MAAIELRHVYKYYEDGVAAVQDFNLEIEKQEFVVFVGPSGCGKSTLSSIIAGLQKPDSGKVFFSGPKAPQDFTDINSLKPKDLKSFRRHCQIIFQDPYSS